MAYVIKQAGGLATTGEKDILDVEPKSIHDRCPIFLGSKRDVEEIIELYGKHKSN